MNFQSKQILKNRNIEYSTLTGNQKLDLIRDAYRISNKKINFTVNTWQKRTKLQILSDFWVGDLAKIVVKNYLQENGLLVTDYDSIRTDNFKLADQFDLKVNDLEIEIKSSIEKYSKDLTLIINKRRIIDNKHLSHENQSNIVIQVFFVPKDLNIAKKFETEMANLAWNNENIKKIAKILELQFEIYIMGWTTRQELKNVNDIFTVSNVESDAKARSYSNFTLDKCFNMDQLLNLLKAEPIVDSHVK